MTHLLFQGMYVYMYVIIRHVIYKGGRRYRLENCSLMTQFLTVSKLPSSNVQDSSGAHQAIYSKHTVVLALSIGFNVAVCPPTSPTTFMVILCYSHSTHSYN